MIRSSNLCLAAAMACVLCSCQTSRQSSLVPPFTAPAPEKIAALLDFAGPVNLTLKIATADDLARIAPRKGVPVAAFRYADPEHTSDTIGVSVYHAGAFMGAKRARLNESFDKSSAFRVAEGVHDFHGLPEYGIYLASDGRRIYQFMMGMGPGGSAYAALLPCRDPRYELVLTQSTDHYDDQDPKDYKDFSHHVSPRKDLRSVSEQVESRVFR